MNIREQFLVPDAPDFEVDWTALDARFEWIRALKNTPGSDPPRRG